MYVITLLAVLFFTMNLVDCNVLIKNFTTNSCLSNSCLNQANCSDLESLHVCRCSDVKGNYATRAVISTYSYRVMQYDYGACICINSDLTKTCDSSKDTCGYKCICKGGYTGKFCESEINECLSNPCRVGACIDKINGYQCQCSNGWTGTNCDVVINYCANSPCKNGGTCYGYVGGYTCSCLPGYTQSNCNTYDPCASNPCKIGLCSGGCRYDPTNPNPPGILDLCNCYFGAYSDNCPFCPE